MTPSKHLNLEHKDHEDASNIHFVINNPGAAADISHMTQLDFLKPLTELTISTEHRNEAPGFHFTYTRCTSLTEEYETDEGIDENTETSTQMENIEHTENENMMTESEHNGSGKIVFEPMAESKQTPFISAEDSSDLGSSETGTEYSTEEIVDLFFECSPFQWCKTKPDIVATRQCPANPEVFFHFIAVDIDGPVPTEKTVEE